LIKYSESIAVDFRNDFTIYPNPATNRIQIEIEGVILEGTEIIIVDLFGKEILRTTCNGNSTSIDVSTLSNGNYIARLERNGILKEVKRLAINN
jgi:hypothetical protein